jgi:hypothetical protein
VAQVALVVFPAARDPAPQAQLLEQVLHLVRIVAGHRQVVRAQRAGDALHPAAAAVATGVVLEFEQHEVLDAARPQRTRRGQAGHAAARDHHLGAPHHRRRAARRRTVAHCMPARHVDAGEAARDGVRRLAARQRQRARAQGAPDECAPLHRQCAATLPHSRS